MNKTNIPPPDEPHIAEVIYDKEGRRIGAIADNYTAKTQEEVRQALGNIARLYGEHLCRRAEREE